MSDIVITGTGVISAAGAGAERVWDAMTAGTTFFTNATARQRADDALPWPVAAVQMSDIPWPDGPPWVDNRKYANPAAHAAVAVTRQALDRAGPADERAGPSCGTVMAVSSTGKEEVGDVMPRLAALARTDPRPLAKLLYDEVPDYSYIRGIPSQLGQFTAMASGFTGSNVVVYGEAGAAGFGALAQAVRMISSAELDRVLVVGIAPQLSLTALAAFDHDERIGTEAVAGRGPFDVGRAGTLLGQAAVAVMVEHARAARARGVTPMAHLLACEVVTAAHRRPALDTALDLVLGQGSWPPGLWWAHGAGSAASDLDECELVGARLGAITTASKGTVGNAFECAGLLDVALAVEALRRREVPPVGLLRKPDPALGGVDFVVGTPRVVPALNSALVTTFSPSCWAPAAGAALLERVDE